MYGFITNTQQIFIDEITIEMVASDTRKCHVVFKNPLADEQSTFYRQRIGL